jgi:2-polyprenyl-3-methyl-5-hydroxy-6-metoxy-1,4-benzoquinol methylase
MLRRFARRRLEGELMDDPSLDVDAHVRALDGLRRINLVSRTAALLWRPIADVARSQGSVSLLDLATGGGDVAIALKRRARRAGLPLRVDACDISAVALRVAAERAERASVAVNLFQLDVLADPIPPGYDIVTAALFLHHLSDDEIVLLLRKASAAAPRLVISDLIRSPTGYGLACVGTRLLSTSRVVHVDGLRSVRAALTLAEARRLADRAGLAQAQIGRHWPARFLMTWCRPGSATAGVDGGT